MVAIVNLAELKRACKRLVSRIGDEYDLGSRSVIFATDRDSLSIQIGGSSEVISAEVLQKGHESHPSSLFWDMAKILRFDRKKKIEIVVSDGELKIERMAFRPLPHRVSQENS